VSNYASSVQVQLSPEANLSKGKQSYDIAAYSKEQSIGDVPSRYDRHMHFLELRH
jgi:choline/glycine/proline betaine transport protein